MNLERRLALRRLALRKRAVEDRQEGDKLCMLPGRAPGDIYILS